MQDSVYAFKIAPELSYTFHDKWRVNRILQVRKKSDMASKESGLWPGALLRCFTKWKATGGLFWDGL